MNTSQSTTTQTSSRTAGRRTKMLGGVFLVALIVMGIVTSYSVEESLDEILSESFNTILDTAKKAVEVWLASETDEAMGWASSNTVIAATEELLDLGSDAQATTLVGHPAMRRLRAHLQPLNVERHQFAIIDRTGRIVAARLDVLVGQDISPALLGLMSAGIDRPGFIVPPLVAQGMLRQSIEGSNAPLMLVAAPITRSDGHAIAVLAIAIDPLKEFDGIFAMGRLGRTGEAFAFSQTGVLLTSSRFEAQLAADGLLPETAGERSVLNVVLRDPGGDLTAGYQPTTPPAERPLTRMVAAAVTDSDGIDLEGYRSYRGRRVVGAWRWLTDLGFGVAIEIDEREAKSLLRPLRRAAWVLFGFLAASAVAILFYTLRIARLRRRIVEVRQLGQYTLLEKLGEGGMGTVYTARHAMLRRPTAIKLLKRDRVTTEDIARFEREVQLTSRLTHPNTLQVYDYGRNPDGIFYYAMELIDGVTLAELIETEGQQPAARVVHLLRQVCGSLAEAHGIGLIHRDIKPPNIMLCQRGGQYDVAKVLDFGLVKSLTADHNLTVDEVVAGTPAYIPPERLMDPKAIDARTDLYAVGAVAYNLLTARDVFDGDSAMVICQQALHVEPTRPSEHTATTVPPALEELVLACLAKDPDARPATAVAMLERLERIAETLPWTRGDAASHA